MIYEIDVSEVVLPYNADSPDLCLPLGLINPLAFRHDYLLTPWVPFEDFTFETDQLGEILTRWSSQSSIFRQTMPCRKGEPKFFCIKEPDKLDSLQVKSWLDYEEGIIWSAKGMLIINSYSDAVVLAVEDSIMNAAFGMTSLDLFSDSLSMFVDDQSNNPDLKDFMAAVRTTWPPCFGISEQLR